MRLFFLRKGYYSKYCRDVLVATGHFRGHFQFLLLKFHYFL